MKYMTTAASYSDAKLVNVIAIQAAYRKTLKKRCFHFLTAD